MSWFGNIRRGLFGRPTPTYDGIGGGRRAIAWQVGNPGAVAALAFSQNELRAKSRDLVRRNAWAAAGVEAFVANAIGTGIKPQSMVVEPASREAIHALWWDWCDEADAAGLTDFYGLQALACRALLEGGEVLIRLRCRRAGLEPGTMQLLEPGEDIKFSAPADVGASYAEFLRTQFRAAAARIRSGEVDSPGLAVGGSEEGVRRHGDRHSGWALVAVGSDLRLRLRRRGHRPRNRRRQRAGRCTGPRLRFRSAARAGKPAARSPGAGSATTTSA